MAGNKGMALAAVLIVLTVLMIIAAGLLELVLAGYKTAAYNDSLTQAYYLARSGADATGRYIITNPSAASVLVNRKSERNNHFGSGQFQVEVKSGENDALLQSIRIEGTGYAKSADNSATLELSRLPADEIIKGAVYCNSGLDISGLIIDGPVQCASGITGGGSYSGTMSQNTPGYAKLTAFGFVHASQKFVTPVEINSEAVIDGDTEFKEGLKVGPEGILRLEARNRVTQVLLKDLDLEGRVDIVATGGRVEIYITDTLTFSEMCVLNCDNPQNLMIYLADGSRCTMMSGNTTCGYFIGPGACIDMQNPGMIILGAVYAGSLVNGSTPGDPGGPPLGAVKYIPLNRDIGILPALQAYGKGRWSR